MPGGWYALTVGEIVAEVPDVTPADRVLQQVYFAITVLHELTHSLWQRAKPKWREPYFENHAVSELTKFDCVELATYGDDPVHNKKPSMWDVGDYFPIPIRYFETIQKPAFWALVVRKYGIESLKMGNYKLNTDFKKVFISPSPYPTTHGGPIPMTRRDSFESNCENTRRDYARRVKDELDAQRISRGRVDAEHERILKAVEARKSRKGETSSLRKAPEGYRSRNHFYYFRKTRGTTRRTHRSKSSVRKPRLQHRRQHRDMSRVLEAVASKRLAIFFWLIKIYWVLILHRARPPTGPHPRNNPQNQSRLGQAPSPETLKIFDQATQYGIECFETMDYPDDISDFDQELFLKYVYRGWPEVKNFLPPEVFERRGPPGILRRLKSGWSPTPPEKKMPSGRIYKKVLYYEETKLRREEEVLLEREAIIATTSIEASLSFVTMSSHSGEKPTATKVDVDDYTTLEKIKTVIEGTTQLYEDGRLNFIPMPTGDPKDPLNLPQWRKILILFSLCFFGAVSLSTQQIAGSLLPVFVLVYAGLDPHILTNPGGVSGGIPSGLPAFPSGTSIGSGLPTNLPPSSTPSGFPLPTGTSISSGFPAGSTPTGIPSGVSTTGSASGGIPVGIPSAGSTSGESSNPLDALAALLALNPNAPTLGEVNRLASFPVLIIGLSNYVLVPLSIAIGRRPVICLCGLLAWTCTLWAGLSQSLESHLAARCIQALGAGAVESLIPLIAQDISFIHQRNRAIGVIWASQGVITLALGIGSSYIVANLSWRWLYFILAILTAASWLMLVAFVPETRWQRTSEEMRGFSENLRPGERRTPIDPDRYGPRTLETELTFFTGIRAKDALLSFVEIVESIIFPGVAWIVLLNAVFIGVSLASSQTMTTVLLAPPYSWSFKYIGYSVVAIVIATVFVYLVGSWGADKVSNWITKRKGGVREPEVHLWSLIFPLFCGIFGCILFGVGGTYVYKVHWMAILSGAAFLNFAFLTINIIGSVYCIESYPKWAGPVLVNVAGFRNIIGFAFTYGVTDWVQARGYMGCFGIYAGAIGLLCLPMPFIWIHGKKLRRGSGVLTRKTTHSLQQYLIKCEHAFTSLSVPEFEDALNQNQSGPFPHTSDALMHVPWGITQALALARSTAAHSVLEASSTITKLGAGIQVTPNFTRILSQLGLQDALSAVGVQPQYLRQPHGKSVQVQILSIATDESVYRALVPAAAVDIPEFESLELQKYATTWLGPERRIVAYYVCSGAFYNVAVLVPDEPGEKSWKKLGDMQQLRKQFEAWDPRIQQLLAMIDESYVWKLRDRPSLKKWVHDEGNLVLLGDSAHPMLPYIAQGAASAVEDAVALATCLEFVVEGKRDLRSVLKVYEALRVPRTVRPTSLFIAP
ncbi:hypothetical protein G7Y89_g1585 [Cudoniella acicularis]|uniref:Major facilitator superfamily (MFS) profile domain-containing protein n=1 Tax=Cudoniella acicularis TaxID=354080 RepID=A0A8H4WA50_9HELO|nr:hypothetical protein G7Y89_g1585 [Cudoniella acicularis]